MQMFPLPSLLSSPSKLLSPFVGLYIDAAQGIRARECFPSTKCFAGRRPLFATTKTEVLLSSLFPSLFGKFYSCWYARRSRDIWRFDIDVSVSGFRPPPPPPFFSSFFVHPFLLSFSSPASPRMNGKGESAADNADKLPSKSLLCVCAPYRSPSLRSLPFPHHRRSPPPPSIDPPIETSLQLAFSERAGKRVR